MAGRAGFKHLLFGVDALALEGDWISPAMSVLLRFRLARPALVLAAALLSGLAYAQATEAPPAEAGTVRLGNLKFVHYGTIFYMKEIAPRHGFKISETVFAKSGDLIPALLKGEFDLVASSAEGAIEARAAGAPVQVVAGFARGGARIIGRPDIEWKGVPDLRGRRVAVPRGGTHEVLLLAELSRHKLRWSTAPGQDVLLVYMQYGTMNAALERREIDAACQSEPQASQAISKGVAREITKPYETEAGEPTRVLLMHERVLADPVLAAKVMRCFVDATRTFLEQPTLAEEYICDRLFEGKLSRADYRLAFTNARFTYEVSPAEIQGVVNAMLQNNLGTIIGYYTRPPAAADWVRTDLVSEARRALKGDAPAPAAAR